VITKGLSLNGKFSFDHFYFNKVARPKTFAVREYLGTDPLTGEDRYAEHREEQPLGYSVYNDANRALYGEAILNYDRTFGNHSLTGMALFNRREYVNLTSGASINNVPERRQGVAGRATYGFKNKYFAEFNFGYNGSENFPAGKRYGFFPSASAGWIVSAEDFWKSEAFSYLKIRASHGQVGSDRIGGRRFLFLTNLNANGAGYRFGDGQQQWTGMTEDQIGTENVSWEVATKTNLGLDAYFFRDKLSIQFDVFNENRKGILIQRAQVPDYIGYLPNSLQYGNLGEARNRGFDAMFELKDQTASGFFYAVRGNFTFAKNRVLENDEPDPRYPYLSGKGIAIDQPFGLVALGLFQSAEEIENSPKQNFMETVLPGDIKYQDVNNDGVVNIDDQMPIGLPRTPEVMFGFGSTVGFKGFEVSLFFTGAARSSMFLEGRSIYPFAEGLGIFNIMEEYHHNRWTGPGSDGIYPAVREYNSQNNYRRSTLWQKDASYLRLRNAEIAYTLPKTLTNKAGINNVRVFLNGTNLYTWDKIKVIDPESNDGTGSYPIQRNINLGLQVNF
jgi:TonB-linked SusC/RagA family outer membrane protein